MTNNSNPIAHELSWKNLRITGRAIPIPFQLTLDKCDTLLHCDELVRLVPGKRLVAFGTWGDKSVVAKLFYATGKTKHHLNREIQGLNALMESEVPTPKILWQGSAQHKKIQIILFERILDGVSLDTLWQNKEDPEAMTALMSHVTVELATQHVLGIVQTDLHLKNYLISPKCIYTLDGADIIKFNGILPKPESLDHLAQFFAQLGIGSEKLQQTLFQVYVKARGWIVNKADTKLLNQGIKKWLEKRWSRYDKKIHRNCTQFVCKKSPQKLIIYDRAYDTPDFTSFLSHPETYFHQKDTEVLKAGRSSTVIKIHLGGHHLVVKRYNIKNSFHWLRRCFRPTRAAKSWRLAQCLQLFGLPTAKPVALIENRFLGLRGTSYFVMEHIPAVHAGEYFTQHPQQEKVAQRVGNLLVNLAKLNLTHGDLKMTNILIHHEHPYMIDLDGMTEHASPLSLRRAFKSEVKRFMKNWEQQPQVKALFEKWL